MRKDQVKKAAGFARRLYDRGFSLLAFVFMALAFALSGFDRQEMRAVASLPGSPADATESRSSWLTRQATAIAKDLKDYGIQNATVYSRVKAEASALEKAQRKGVEITDLNDLYGMRVVVDNELDVYRCLNYLCDVYPIVPGTMKNYIAAPKPSGYRSVHVVAQVETNRVEFQLRTQEMHEAAEREHEAYKQRMRAAA